MAHQGPVSPPTSIVYTVERWAPGIYREFWDAIVQGVSAPVFITSYWRDPGTNRLVGGHPDSQHLVGLGLDLQYADRSAALADVSRFASLGLVAVDEGTHVHIQAWPAGVARSSGLLRAVGV